MTEDQKKRIRRLRLNGRSYADISTIVGVSVGSVKMLCSREGIVQGKDDGRVRCLTCGEPITMAATGRKARFCSSACRVRHWRETSSGNSGADRICACCGGLFRSGAKDRKYCSHECYIRDRFGGAAHDHE